MKWKDVHLKSKLILYIVAGTFLVLITSTAVIISTATSHEEALAYQQSIEMASKYANQFDSDMSENHAIGKTIANFMVEYKSGDRDEVNDILRNLLEQNPNLIGTYVCFEPNAFDGRDSEYIGTEGHDSTGRFIPYWNKLDGPVVLEPLLDYDTLDYYQLPKKLKTDVVTEPYLYEGVIIISYVTPVLRDGEFIGIGGVDVSLNYLDEVVSKIKIFDTGYALATSNTGILLSHPDHKEWIGTITLYDLDVPEISSMADDIRMGKNGHIETVDPTTGKTVILFYEPVKTGKYSFLLVVPKDEMLAGVAVLRNDLIIISTIAIGFMGAIAFLIALSITKPIDEIVYDFKRISDEAVHGKVDSRANTDVEIDFKAIPFGLNDILDSLQKYSEELLKANKELKSLDEMKDNFLANVSHELRTPLTSITGYSQIVCDETLGELNDKQKNAINTVIRNADRLGHLIDSLLYVSEVGAENIEYKFEPVQIAEIIDNSVLDMVLLVEKNELKLEKDVPDNLPSINGDKEKLTVLLNNLIDNSIKFTPKDGRISLIVLDEENCLHIMVKDTGIGIVKEMLPNLFQKFYQIDSSIRRKYGGTGVGLYICKNIVEAHKGKIWIESEEGVGTTVHVKLPK
ncbi:MAG: GHKL domain-containing protein [Methanosarcinaceae archaeon]|nr:GHKL domain-containing protein [Methanosarcinaceae archaeon]